MGAGSLEAVALTAAGKPSTENTKSYFRIGELAQEFGITLRTLRFYEQKGLLQPKRRGTTRLYSEADRARIRVVLLGRKIGFSLRDVKLLLEVYTQSANAQQLSAFLQKAEKQLAHLERQRTELEQAVTELTKLIGHIRARLACTAQKTDNLSRSGTDRMI